MRRTNLGYYCILIFSLAVILPAIFGKDKVKIEQDNQVIHVSGGTFFTPRPTQRVITAQEPRRATEFAQIETKTQKPINDTFEKISACKWTRGTQKAISDLCKKKHISFPLIMAIAWEESRFKENVTNNNEMSVGPFQIQPKWNKSTMRKFGYSREDLFNPIKAASVTVEIVSAHFKRFDDVNFVLMAYNGGGEYAMRNIGKGIVTEYAKEVLQKASEFEE